MLCRDPDFALSISTVGRILKPLVASGRVQPLAFYYGRVKPRRRRQFKHYARRFLEYLITQLPYPLISIQVDGGSEFKKEFEQACQALEIPLFVLPPKKSKNNGRVGRANGTTRYAFYLYLRRALESLGNQ